MGMGWRVVFMGHDPSVWGGRDLWDAGVDGTRAAARDRDDVVVTIGSR